MNELRDRLQLHGFTAGRALADLDEAVRVWHAKHPNPIAYEPGVPQWDAVVILSELGDYVNSTEEWVSYEEPKTCSGSWTAERSCGLRWM